MQKRFCEFIVIFLGKAVLKLFKQGRCPTSEGVLFHRTEQNRTEPL